MHMHLIGISYIFMHMHYCTSFRYARYTRVDVKHAVLEPNIKTVFGGYLQKMEGPAEATEDPAQGRKGPRPKIILTLT